MKRRILALFTAFVFSASQTLPIRAQDNAQSETNSDDGPVHGFPDIDSIREDEDGHTIIDFYPGDGGPPTPVHLRDFSPVEKEPGRAERPQPEKVDNHESELTTEDIETDDDYEQIIHETTITVETFSPPPDPVEVDGNDSPSRQTPDNRPVENSVSGGDRTADETYEEILTEDDTLDPSTGTSSRDHVESNRSNNPTARNGTTGRSKNYGEMIAKGKQAKATIANKVQIANARRNDLRTKLIASTDGTSDEELSGIYNGTNSAIDSSQKRRMSSALFDYAKFNANFGLVPFLELTSVHNYEFEKQRKLTAENELKRLFPNVRDGNISNLMKGRNMVMDWKVAEEMIGESLFNDLFIDTTQVINELQLDLNATYIGPTNSKIIDTLQIMEQQSKFRISRYIEEEIIKLEKPTNQNGYVPTFVAEAIRLLQEGLRAVDSGDLILAADKILEAKKLLNDAYGVVQEADFGPMDLFGSVSAIGLVSSRILSKAFIRLGFEQALKNVATKADRALLSKLARQYIGLKPGQTITHNSTNPGILHYIDAAPGASQKVSDTFLNEQYNVVTSQKPEKFYRYFVLGKNYEMGSYVSRTRYYTREEADKLLALPERPTHVVEITIPPNEPFFEGVTKSNFGGKPGGGSQVYIIIDRNEGEKYKKWVGTSLELR